MRKFIAGLAAGATSLLALAAPAAADPVADVEVVSFVGNSPLFSTYVDYTLVVKNTGGQIDGGFTTFTYPPEVIGTFAPVGCVQYDPLTGTQGCFLPFINPGDTFTYQIRALVQPLVVATAFTTSVDIFAYPDEADLSDNQGSVSCVALTYLIIAC